MNLAGTGAHRHGDHGAGVRQEKGRGRVVGLANQDTLKPRCRADLVVN
jgi:hypothetical protein